MSLADNDAAQLPFTLHGEQLDGNGKLALRSSRSGADCRTGLSSMLLFQQ